MGGDVCPSTEEMNRLLANVEDEYDKEEQDQDAYEQEVRDAMDKEANSGEHDEPRHSTQS